MLPILQIGPAAIPTGPLILLIGFWAAWSLAEKTAKREGVSPNQVSNLILIIFIAGLLGARIGYAVNHPSAFADNLYSILSLRPSMLDLGSGLLIAFLAGVIYLNRTHLPVLQVLDSLTPPAGVMALAIILANFTSGATFGSPTSVPWAIQIWGAVRHPIQVYAFCLSLIIFLLTFPWKNSPSITSGVRFCAFSALTSFAVIFIESFRGNSALLIGNIRSTQIIAFAALIMSLVFLAKFQQKEKDD